MPKRGNRRASFGRSVKDAVATKTKKSKLKKAARKSLSVSGEDQIAAEDGANLGKPIEGSDQIRRKNKRRKPSRLRKGRNRTNEKRLPSTPPDEDSETKLARPVEEGIMCGGVEIGSAKDLYLPVGDFNRVQRDEVWHFFRRRHSDKHLMAMPDLDRVWCQRPGCACPAVLTGGTTKGITKQLWDHMLKVHELGKKEVLWLKAEEEEAASNAHR